AKSRSTRLRGGNSFPSSSGRNVPYVTPRMKNFSSPTKMNLPRTWGRAVGRRMALVTARSNAGAKIQLNPGAWVDNGVRGAGTIAGEEINHSSRHIQAVTLPSPGRFFL